MFPSIPAVQFQGATIRLGSHRGTQTTVKLFEANYPHLDADTLVISATNGPLNESSLTLKSDAIGELSREFTTGDKEAAARKFPGVLKTVLEEGQYEAVDYSAFLGNVGWMAGTRGGHVGKCRPSVNTFDAPFAKERAPVYAESALRRLTQTPDPALEPVEFNYTVKPGPLRRKQKHTYTGTAAAMELPGRFDYSREISSPLRQRERRELV